VKLKNFSIYIQDRRDLFSEESEFESFLNHLFYIPPVSIRINTRRVRIEELLQFPSFKKVKLEKFPFGKNLYFLNEGSLKGEIIEDLLGLFYFQSPSSMLPVEILELNGDELVLDMCAAPGSKSTQIAEKLYPNGFLVANDVKAKRLQSLGNNMEKLGFPNQLITLMNAHRLGKIFPETFDRVLLDAPCSGEGSWFRHAQTAVYLREYVKKSSNVQKQLIMSAFKALKKGGIMVYSTCTYAPEENEEVIEFLLNYAKENVKLLEINLPIKGIEKGLTFYKGRSYSKDLMKTVRIYPHATHMPGFFLAKIKKL
jgi:NOL1/NOP2/sun family putative RNA methylase